MATRRQTGLHHPVSQYAKSVVSGKLRAQCGKYEILACQRHLDDLKRQGTPDFPYVFDVTRADRILRWFGQCNQVRGVDSGKPIQLEPWQVFDLGCTYGWVDMETGARRFNHTYNKRGRGNYKSTEKSGQALYHMCGDAIYPPYHPEEAIFEREPEVECAAVDRGQAMRVFGDAKKIAEASPNIARRLYIPKSNPVVHRTRGGFMRALSKDTKNKDSGAPSYFVVDEYHAHVTSEIYDLGFDSFGKRAQSLLDVITTAGDDAENKPCFVEESYAKRVLEDDSVRDDRYFVMIREIDDSDNPHDRSCWAKANPVLRSDTMYARYLLGQIVTEHDAAYASGDYSKIRKFLTRRMCRWQNASENSYLDERCMALLKKSQIPPKEFAALTDGLGCYCGFDLGKRIDLSGVGSVFPLPDGRYAIKMHGFMPENGATRHEHSDKVPYRDWAKAKYVTLTPGDVTDNSYVYNWICAGERDHGWKVIEVDYDGHNATDLALAICGERNNEDFVVEVAQTCAGQNLAVKGFREMLLQGKIITEKNQAMIVWFANAREIKNNYDDSKLSKRFKDDSQRIDPVAATMNAMARALVKPERKPDLTDLIASGKFSM